MNKIFNTIKSEIKAVISGTQLTKNYEVEKEPYMQAGLHNLWSVFRAEKRGKEDQKVSIFMLEKKSWDKKKSEMQVFGTPSSNMKEEAFQALKKDPMNIMKLRHPSVLNLIEQPAEDDKYIVFITEPVAYSLDCLSEVGPGASKENLRDKIPSVLEIKCIMLELLETLNFLHQNAKCVHGGISPENLFITESGKVKLGGFNFCAQIGTEESQTIPVNPNIKFNQFHFYPNLKFAAPEISQSNPKCSPQSDLFSAILILYYLLQLEKGKDPYLLSQYEKTSPQAHSSEILTLQSKLNSKLQGFDSEVQEIIRGVLQANTPQMRGNLVQTVSKNWFQDPLLKTIRYLENIDYKEQAQKVQFLNGLQKVLDKFENKILIDKIMPLLMQSLSKDTQLSVNVLPIIITQLESQTAMTSTQFRNGIWPSIISLCNQKELPAQALYLLLKNQELIVKFVSQQEFGQVFLPLINKSLACGVPKLQLLALSKVQSIFQQLEYQTVKTQVIPRVLQILDTTKSLELKLEVFATLKTIMKAIDSSTLKNEVMKSLEKLRAKETDPKVCMKMLEIYEEIGKVLGPEEVGMKILPGIIPMLISAQFTKGEFKDLIGSVRRLLDQIENFRMPQLPDSSSSLNQIGQSNNQVNDIFLGIGNDQKQQQSLNNHKPINQDSDVFDFLSGNSGGQLSQPSSLNSLNIQKPIFQDQNDVFSKIMQSDNKSQNKNILDPFSSKQEIKPVQFGQQKTVNRNSALDDALSFAWDQPSEQILNNDPFSTPSKSFQPQINSQQLQNSMASMNLNQISQQKQQISNDPFADILSGSYQQNKNPSSDMNSFLFNNQQSQPSFNMNNGMNNFQNNFNDPFAGISNSGNMSKSNFGQNQMPQLQANLSIADLTGMGGNNTQFYQNNANIKKNNQNMLNFD